MLLSRPSYVGASQKPADSDRPISAQQLYRACLQAMNELAAKDAQIAELKAQNADLRGMRTLLDEQIALYKATRTLLDETIKKYQEVQGKDGLIVAELKAQKAILTNDLARVRKERDRAYSLLKTVGTGALVVGLLIGALAAVAVGGR